LYQGAERDEAGTHPNVFLLENAQIRVVHRVDREISEEIPVGEIFCKKYIKQK
jgi:hypothetical protein